MTGAVSSGPFFNNPHAIPLAVVVNLWRATLHLLALVDE